MSTTLLLLLAALLTSQALGWALRRRGALTLAGRVGALPEAADAPPIVARDRVRDYYTEASADYGVWSPGYYMHFGYARCANEVFRLEKMLANLSEEVLLQLHVAAHPAPLLLDLGCGMGAVARQAALMFPAAEVTGITLVPSQVREGSRLNRAQHLDARVHLYCDDFEASNLPNRHFDAAYAVEAACYGEGPAKARFLAEAKRVLKPGARLVVADGFRRQAGPLPGWLQGINRWLCDCWALGEFAQIDAFTAELARLGFTEVAVRDLRWRVAPSVAYVPRTTFKFFARVLLHGELFRLKKWQWKNLVSPWLTMLVGLQRRHFGYYLVTATRAH